MARASLGLQVKRMLDGLILEKEGSYDEDKRLYSTFCD
jgi:hypothetical protein